MHASLATIWNYLVESVNFECLEGKRTSGIHAVTWIHGLVTALYVDFEMVLPPEGSTTSDALSTAACLSFTNSKWLFQIQLVIQVSTTMTRKIYSRTAHMPLPPLSDLTLTSNSRSYNHVSNKYKFCAKSFRTIFTRAHFFESVVLKKIK